MIWFFGILCALFLLLQAPVHFYVHLAEEVEIRIRILFFKIQPGAPTKKPKKKKKKAKEKPPKKEDAPKTEPAQKHSLLTTLLRRKGGKKALLASAFRVLAMGKRAVSKILRGLHLTKLNCGIQVGKEQAYDTALFYAYTCSAVYPAVALLAQWGKCRAYTVSVVPDFDHPGIQMDVETAGWMRLGRVLWKAIVLLVRALIEILRKPKGSGEEKRQAARQAAEEKISKVVQRMNGQSIDSMMGVTLDKIRSMADVNTVIGDPITVDGATIIPISKVSYGFAAGGSDLPCKAQAQKDLFGGGSGGGVNVIPVGFLTVQDGKVRLLQLDPFTSTMDRIVSMAPGLMDSVESLVQKVREMLEKKKAEKEEAEAQAESAPAEAAPENA